MNTATATLAPARQGLIERLRAWFGAAAGRDARQGRLPFAGLPAGIDLVAPSEPALLLCQDALSREQLLLSLLGGALADRRVTWLCAPSGAPPALGPDIRNAALAGQLNTVAWTQDAALQLRQLGAAHLMREMAASGMRMQDLFILDVMDPWLRETPEDCALEAGVAEAARGLERWSRLHDGPVIALAPAQYRGQPLLPLLARSKLARLATFEARGPSAQLEIIRWGHGAHGNAAAGRFLLEHHADGRWHCRQRSALDPHAVLAADDADTVHTTRDVLADAGELPAGWRAHPGIDALLAATRDAVAATVVLGHDHADSLVVLADAVARLRREHPHLLKIVIRETGAALRRSGELALLRLGANAVVERQLGFAHVQQRVAALRGATYARSRDAADPSRTLRSLSPDPVQGYLAPRDFCQSVERMLDRTADTPLQHSLVQLPLLAHIAHLDALLACNPRRDGDLITADASGIWLFLFGCADDDVMPALEALFTLPCSELAAHVEIATDRGEQQQVLARLRASAESAPVDYTTILRNIAPDKARQAVQAAVLPIRGPQAPRCVQSHVLPLRAATV